MKYPLLWLAAVLLCLGLACSAANARPVAVGCWLLSTLCAACASQFREK